MAHQWRHLLEGLEQNPGRRDLVSGVICISKNLESPEEQASLLAECSALVFPEQPILALQMARLSLLLAPREQRALKLAREIFKRRARASAEQRVAEIIATAVRATALSPLSSIVDDGQSLVGQEITIKTNVVAPTADDQKNDEKIQSDDLPASTPKIGHPGLEADLFCIYLEESKLDQSWKKFSTGFSQNNAGLVAFVNLLFTMKLIDENEKTKALVVLYRMIKDRPDESGGEEIYDSFFIPESSRMDLE